MRKTTVIEQLISKAAKMRAEHACDGAVQSMIFLRQNLPLWATKIGKGSPLTVTS